MRVRDIMTSNPRTAALETTLEEIATMMKDEDVGVIPVLDDGEIAGIVTDRDIVVRCIADGKTPAECTAEEIMSEELRTIESESDLDDAAAIMGEAQIRRLPVVKDGKLVGMISLGDIAVKAHDEERTTADTLEEVSQGVKQRGQRARGSEESEARGRDEGKGRRTGNDRGGDTRERGRVQQTGETRRVSERGRPEKVGHGEQGVSMRKAPQGAQGISNRAAGRENARQRKVAPKRAEGRGNRGAGRRRAS